MNNLSLYCGLTDWRMSASDTDLPVCIDNLNLAIKDQNSFRSCLKFGQSRMHVLFHMQRKVIYILGWKR